MLLLHEIRCLTYPGVLVHRDGRRCCYCFKQLGLTDATVDHVLPVAAGGPNMPENMHSSCSPCNSAKSCFWLGDLQWTVQDPVGFPPATIGEQARPCPFVAPPGDAVVYMSDLCFKVREARVPTCFLCASLGVGFERLPR